MRLNIREAVSGMVIQEPIVIDNIMLVNKGGVLTPSLINRLNKFGITFIDIVSDKDTKDTIDNNLMEDVRESLLEEDIEKIEINADKMVSAVLKDFSFDGKFSNFKYNLQSYANDNQSLDHSIRVATFSIVLAYLYNEDLKKYYSVKEIEEMKVNLRDVAVAALLHDKGKNYYDVNALSKIEDFVKLDNSRNFPGIKDIPTDRFDDRFVSVYSCYLADYISDLPSNVKYMILYSSEMENNNGPLKAVNFGKDNKNSFIVGAKIIHLCSLYDDYLAHYVSNNESLENTVSVIGHAASSGVINEDLANLFLNNVPIYSVGNKVLLSTGEEAVVVKSYTGYKDTTRPTVKVISTGRTIDLRDEKLITIVGVCHEDITVDDLIAGQLKEVEKSSKRR